MGKQGDDIVSDAPIIVSEREGVLDVVLNRPDKLNAINEEMRAVLMRAARTLATHADVRVMLIRAEGKYFSAGADISAGMSPDFNGSPMAFREWYRNDVFHP